MSKEQISLLIEAGLWEYLYSRSPRLYQGAFVCYIKIWLNRLFFKCTMSIQTYGRTKKKYKRLRAATTFKGQFIGICKKCKRDFTNPDKRYTLCWHCRNGKS